VPKTEGQEDLIKRIAYNDIILVEGPAGTGKTHLPVCVAMEMLAENERSLSGGNGIEKVVLVRPAVTAGEDLGYLPGDINEKMDPFLRPFKDSIIKVTGWT